MTSFLSLPPELKSIVVETLSLKDIKNLRLSCRQLGAFLETLILHTISFDINARNLSSSSGIPKLQHLATRKTKGASRATKCVTIKCLSPEYDPMFEAESYVNRQWITNVLPRDTPTCIVGRKQMQTYLYHALASLKNVSSVSWTINQYDEEWVQRTVLKALLSLHNLRSLRIDIDWARIPIPLHHIQNLYDITIIDSKPSSNSGIAYQTYLNLGKMIARSPQLSGIHVHRGDYGSITADISASLHQLFWCFPASAAPLRLTRLTLNRVFVKMDRHTLPHMNHLKALDLSNLLEPDDKHIADNVYGNAYAVSAESDLHAAQTLVGSAIDAIWLALIDIGVQLEEIKVKKVTKSLLNYLETYSGAHKLHIKLSQPNLTLAESEDLASRFFGSSLTRHVATLEDLQIEAADDGMWCFGEHNKSVLSACTKLRTLGISISPSLLKATSSSSRPGSGGNVAANSEWGVLILTEATTVGSLLDVAARQLSSLQSLNITVPASVDRFEGYWCGYSVSQQFSWVCETITQMLCAYTAPQGGGKLYNRLPTVVVGEKTCKEMKLEPLRLEVAGAVEKGIGSVSGLRWVYRQMS